MHDAAIPQFTEAEKAILIRRLDERKKAREAALANARDSAHKRNQE